MRPLPLRQQVLGERQVHRLRSARRGADIVASDSWRAIRLKLADIEDNLSDLPENHGLRKRYERARSALTKALEEMS